MASSARIVIPIIVDSIVIDEAESLEVNGSLAYESALALLQFAASYSMSGSIYGQLVEIADELNKPGGIQCAAFAQQMFDNVVLGNAANAYWNGGSNGASSLGDLSAASTHTQFEDLIGKWLLGDDMPGTLPSSGAAPLAVAYETSDLPLFLPAGPSIQDVAQGQIGDCWLLAALGETAKLDPSLITNMITSKGNGVYRVEFQVDGQPDWVTVNNELPNYTDGSSQYDGSTMMAASSTTSSWAPLIEKAAAELSEQTGVETGLTDGSGSNQYYDLTGGYGEGITMITGQAYSAYDLAGESAGAMSSLLSQLQQNLAAGQDVLLATSAGPAGGDLIADHMFAVKKIDAADGRLNLFNPWGANAWGAGKAENFTIAGSALIADQASFYVAVGTPAMA